MPADAEQLVVQLEARIRDFERNFERANRTARTNFKAIEDRGSQSADRLAGVFNRLSAPKMLGAIGIGLGAKEVLDYTQAWVKAQNTLKTAGVANENVGRTLDAVFQIAQRQGTALAPLVTLYGRVKQAATELGASESQTATFTEGVALALRVAGTNSEQASGALLQLSQLLGSGTVRAEEFNSVLEGARPILQAVAKGMEGTGGSVASLRTMVLAGKVTSQEFFAAFLRGMGTLQDSASKASDTVGQAFNRVQNALTKYIGSTDANLGVSSRIATGLTALANNFDTVANSVLLLGTVFATALIGRGLTPVTAAIGTSISAMKGAVTGINGVQAAIVAATARAEAGTLALRGFAAASSFLGGPIGIALAGLAVAFAIASNRTAEAEAKATRYAAALERVKAASAGAGAAAKDAAGQFFATESNRLARQMRSDEAEIRSASLQIQASIDGAIRGANISHFGSNNAATEALKGIKAGLGDTARSALTTKEKLFELANANPQFQALADRLSPLLDKLAGIRAAVVEAKQGVEKLASESAAAKLQAQLGPLPSYQETTRAVLDDPVARKHVTEGFTREQTRLYRMSAEARRVQVEAERIYNNALENGIELTKQQARGIADFIIGAEKAEQHQRNLRSFSAETAQTELQAKLVGQGTFESTKQLETLRLINQAKAESIPLTARMLAQIDQEATKRATAVTALERAQGANQRLIDLQHQLGDLGVSSIEGLIEGTKSWADVLNDSWKLLLRMTLQAALLGNGPLGNMFGTAGTGGKTGGLIGSLFSGLGLASGGYVAGPGSSRSDSIPARLSNGEYVVNAKATAQHRALLEAVNSGKVLAFADGGIVLPAPTLPSRPARPGSAPLINIAPTINTTVEGGSRGPQADQELADRIGKAVEERAQQIATAALRQQMRPGGMLNPAGRRC